MQNKKELTGQRFGKLMVVGPSELRSKSGSIQWECQCDCGTKKLYSSYQLLRRSVVSCGCWRKERLTTHGKKHTRIYGIWGNMKNRCCNKNNPQYKDYGGRKIYVCGEWQNSFETFYDWSMENGYADNLCIDRIDNNDSYSPDNCRWTNNYVQANNKRNTVFVTINGETHSLHEWCIIKNKNYGTVYSRHWRGWSDDKLFN